MRHWLKLMSLFLIGFALAAQGDADSKLGVEKTKLKHQYPSVKINIAGLGNTLNGGIGFAFDWPLAKHWFIEAELGPILYNPNVRYKGESHYGLRTRGSLKYIVNVAEDDDAYTYFKGVIKYNRVKTSRFLNTLSFDGNFRKEQLIEGTLETFGPSIHLGFLQLFGENERFFIDYSGGLGLIYWNYPLELPPGFNLLDEDSFLFTPNNPGGFFDLILSFKFGMYLGKE